MALSVLALTCAIGQKAEERKAPATLTIKSSVNGSAWSSDGSIYPLKGEKVVLKVDRAPGAVTRWYQILPDLSKRYKNANFPWDKDPYKWIGLAKIDYSRKELTQFKGQWEIEPFRPTNSDSFLSKLASSIPGLNSLGADSHYHDDVGSFWFQVEVEKDGKTQRSAGIEESDKMGLSPKVFRVSIRDGEGYVGYLTSFFNVPGLFGSVMGQANNYIGADCSKVLAAAYGKWKGKPIDKSYNVSSLVSLLPKLAEFDIVGGKPDKAIKWREEVNPGDLIAVKYPGEKQYQHIGALFADADKDGFLSEDDVVLHAGPDPLNFRTLKAGGFNGHVVILEPKFSVLSEGAASKPEQGGKQPRRKR